MFLLEGKRVRSTNVSPAVISNSDMLKAQMKTVHKKLLALDPGLSLDKVR